MKTTISIFLAVFSSFILILEGAALGAEITGTARLTASEKLVERESAKGSLSANTTVTARTPDYAPVAYGTTDENGVFKLEVGDLKEGAWFFIEVGSGEGKLMGVFTGGEANVSLVTETLVTAMLKLGVSQNNFTAAEIDLIKGRLYDLAAEAGVETAENATDGIEALLANEKYRLALGDLVYTYSTPGDTIEEVENISALARILMPVFLEEDKTKALEVATEDAQIEFEGRLLSKDELVEQIKEFEKSFDILDWSSVATRVRVEEDFAELETEENAGFVFKPTNLKTENLTFNFNHRLIKVDGKWRLAKRWRKDCKPEKAYISTTSSRDWVGARPCVFESVENGNAGEITAKIKSIYFAMDDHSLFWRLEHENNFSGETGDVKRATLSSDNLHVSFLVQLFDRINGEPEAYVNSQVAKNKGVTYSLNKAGRLATDGFPETVTYLTENDHVASGYAAGTIPIEDLHVVGAAFYANARIILISKEGESTVLSQGTPIRILLPNHE